MNSELTLILRINEYFNALDDRRFDVCLDCFTELFDSDYTSLVGGEPFKSISRDTNMVAWTGMLSGFKSTHHLVGNHEIKFIDSDNCRVKAKVIATHCLERPGSLDEVWTLGGDYDITMVKSNVDGQWRINNIKFIKAWSNGSHLLLQEAAKVCEERKSNST
jgi:SnoaL-like domain